MQTNTVLHMLMALCALNEGETKVDKPEYVKIRLPGESPWGEVVARNGDTVTVKITNQVAGDYTAEDWSKMLDTVFQGKETPDWRWDGKDQRMHSYRFGDVISVHPTEYGLEPVSKN